MPWEHMEEKVYYHHCFLRDQECVCGTHSTGVMISESKNKGLTLHCICSPDTVLTYISPTSDSPISNDPSTPILPLSQLVSFLKK